MTDIAANLAAVRRRIETACRAAGRDPAGVVLVAVTKGFDAAAVRAAAAAGQVDFAENYLQEALPKLDTTADLPLTWHFIGPVQSNKTRDLAARFAWVHGIERLKIAERLSQQRAGAAPLQVCVQVNISGEASKSGCAPHAAAALCRAVAALPNLELRGLMALPAPPGRQPDPRAPYRELQRLIGAIRADGLPLDTLSAGMSDDLEHAIAAGATLVRVGTAIFGQRT